MAKISEPEPRSVIVVIHQLLRVIPDNEKDLIQDLNDYAGGLFNIAPELLVTSTYWLPLGKILQKHIKTIDTDWKETLVKIHNNITDL
jgi:hypothetical protein